MKDDGQRDEAGHSWLLMGPSYRFAQATDIRTRRETFLTLPLDGPGYVAIPQYEREPESVADVLGKAISCPGTFPLLATVVRTAISLELPTTFPTIDHQNSKLYEMTERLRLGAWRNRVSSHLRASGEEADRLKCLASPIC